MVDTGQKIALVTGAGSGIGRVTTLALIEAGYTVVLAGRRRNALQETVDLTGAGAQTLIVPTDVTDAISVAELFKKIESAFGRLDLLFNNAGIAPPDASLEELSPEQWQAVVDANLTGPFLCTREAFLLMKRQVPQGGRVINNGSLAAMTPRPRSAPYAATKHGVSGLTKATALDGRPFNIACGQIDIGNAGTSMAAGSHQGILQPNGETLSEPLMDVTHVAAAVVQMAALPLDANVLFMAVMATKMPFVGRG